MRKQSILLLIFLSVAFSFLLIESITPYGAAISNDSLYYLNTAKNISLGKGFVHEDYSSTGTEGVPTTTWPVLYPLVLSSVYSVPGADQIQYPVGYLNAVLFLVTLVILFRLTADLSDVKTSILSAIVFSSLPPVLVVYMYVWSETLFIPLLLASYYFLMRFMTRRSGSLCFPYLLASVFFLILASSTRYIGVVFFPALLLCLWIGMKSGKEKVKYASVSLVVFVFGISPGILRNLHYSGHLSGAERGVPDNRIVVDFLRLGEVIYTDMFAASVLSLVIFLAGLSFFGYEARKRDNVQKVSYPAVWAICYLLSLVVLRSTQSIDLDTRMIAPVVPFFVLFIVAIAVSVKEYMHPQLLMVTVALFLVPIVIGNTNVYTNLLKSWQDEKVPGNIGGVFYNNITNPGLAPLSQLKSQLGLKVNELLLTDFQRPILLDYILGNVRVKKLSDSEFDDREFFKQSVNRVFERYGAGSGVLMMTTDRWKKKYIESQGGVKKNNDPEARDKGWIFVRLH